MLRLGRRHLRWSPANVKVTYINNPSKDIDSDFDFGTRNGLISPNVEAKGRTLEMAYLDFGTHDGLISLSVGDQERDSGGGLQGGLGAGSN